MRTPTARLIFFVAAKRPRYASHAYTTNNRLGQLNMACLLPSKPLRLFWRAICTSGFASLVLSACSNDSSSRNDAASRSASASTAASIPAVTTALELRSGAIGAQNMIAYAEGVSSSPQGDQFAKRFDDKPLLGHSFKVTVPYDKYKSSLHYSYDSEQERLKIWTSLGSTFHRDRESDPKLDYLILTQNSVYGTAKPMSNAFGVTKAVTPVSHDVVGIGSTRDTYVGLFRKDKYSSKDYIFYAALEKTIAIAPEPARAAVVDLEMDIEGVIVAGKNGHPVVCKHTETQATIDYLYQETWNECVILARITHIGFHSPKLGMIAEWNGPAGAVATKQKKSH